MPFSKGNIPKSHKNVISCSSAMKSANSLFRVRQKSKLRFYLSYWQFSLAQVWNDSLTLLECSHTNRNMIIFTWLHKPRTERSSDILKSDLNSLIEDVDSILLWEDVLFFKITSAVYVTHPVAASRIRSVDVEQKFFCFHVNNLIIPR